MDLVSALSLEGGTVCTVFQAPMAMSPRYTIIFGRHRGAEHKPLEEPPTKESPAKCINFKDNLLGGGLDAFVMKNRRPSSQEMRWMTHEHAKTS